MVHGGAFVHDELLYVKMGVKDWNRCDTEVYLFLHYLSHQHGSLYDTCSEPIQIFAQLICVCLIIAMAVPSTSSSLVSANTH